MNTMLNKTTIKNAAVIIGSIIAANMECPKRASAVADKFAASCVKHFPHILTAQDELDISDLIWSNSAEKDFRKHVLN